MNTHKTRIIFVDDEPMVLNGIRRLMHRFAEKWEVEYAGSGAEVLQRFQKQPFDVIVADMRMPGMNGAELLNTVMGLYPKTIRFILSGQTDKDLIMRCVGATHQFLAKPCDPAELESTLTRATALEYSMSSSELREIVSRIDNLPAFPLLYKKVMEVLQNPSSSLEDIAELIEQDVAVTAKILKLVNSAFFGIKRHVSGVSEAILYLGLETVRGLLMSIGTFNQFKLQPDQLGFMNALWAHSLDVAILAKRIAETEQVPSAMIESVYTAGLLHDVGKLILITYLPEIHHKVEVYRAENHCSLIEAESRVYRSTHADLGAYLLGLWGLPPPLVEAVLYHHTPSLLAINEFTPLTAVHAANAICGEKRPAASSQTIPVDLAYLKRIHLLEKLPEWRVLSA
ncbi:MAG: response regulator [Verrucomicrobiota bacterium]|nr:response regulator [Verrucomicrobiota bacterium]